MLCGLWVAGWEVLCGIALLLVTTGMVVGEVRAKGRAPTMHAVAGAPVEVRVHTSYAAGTFGR